MSTTVFTVSPNVDVYVYPLLPLFYKWIYVHVVVLLHLLPVLIQRRSFHSVPSKIVPVTPTEKHKVTPYDTTSRDYQTVREDHDLDNTLWVLRDVTRESGVTFVGVGTTMGSSRSNIHNLVSPRESKMFEVKYPF